MSVKKPKEELDSTYSGGIKNRSRILDDTSRSSNGVGSARWKSILSCCWKRDRERIGQRRTLKEYNSNEWDYIVEKLVVKRVPLALYATQEDEEEHSGVLTDRDKIYKEFSHGPSAAAGRGNKEMRDKQVYSAMTDIGSSLYFLRTKSRGELPSKTSNKNMRFERDEDLLDEDAPRAGPSNYDNKLNSSDLRTIENQTRNEFLNRFSALHPDLKENERPPKDPYPLNAPGSKRSLAEDISELASAKKITALKAKKGNERRKQGGSNVYLTVSDTSREISTVLGEEIPTRDKPIIAKHAPSIREKIGSTSCLPYRQRAREVNLPRDLHRSSETPDDRDPDAKSSRNRGSRFSTRHVSSEKNSTDNKLANLSKPIENGSVSQATSYASDDYKNANSAAGTTLRWKIIIKHHQPTASQTASESVDDYTENSTHPGRDEGSNGSNDKSLKTNTKSYDKVETKGKKDRWNA